MSALIHAYYLSALQNSLLNHHENITGIISIHLAQEIKRVGYKRSDHDLYLLDRQTNRKNRCELESRLKFRTPVICQNGHKALWYWMIDNYGIGEVKHCGVISKRCICPKFNIGEGYKRIGDDQQFTGKQDKNGRDIYEGDILAYGGDNHNTVVVWGDNDYGVGFYTEESRLKGEDGKRTHGLPPSTTPMEVIGNITETPKLKARWGRS